MSTCLWKTRVKGSTTTFHRLTNIHPLCNSFINSYSIWYSERKCNRVCNSLSDWRRLRTYGPAATNLRLTRLRPPKLSPLHAPRRAKMTSPAHRTLVGHGKCASAEWHDPLEACSRTQILQLDSCHTHFFVHFLSLRVQSGVESLRVSSLHEYAHSMHVCVKV